MAIRGTIAHMKQWLRNWLSRAHRALTPKPDQSQQLAEAKAREAWLTGKLAEIAEAEAMRDAAQAFESMAGDLIEARAMAGAGPCCNSRAGGSSRSF